MTLDRMTFAGMAFASMTGPSAPVEPPPPAEDPPVSFDALIEKVRQAEIALEAKERETTADWRQMRTSWRSAWTPGRIVIAGLVGGFLFGRAEPFKRAAGGGTLQLISALSSLLAGDKAKQAAEEAGDAADAAEDAGRRAGAASAVREERVDRPQAAASAPDPAASPAADPTTAPRVGPTERSRADARSPRGDRPPYDLPENYRDSGQL